VLSASSEATEQSNGAKKRRRGILGEQEWLEPELGVRCFATASIYSRGKARKISLATEIFSDNHGQTTARIGWA
jgi:hypothetical protein